MTETWKPIPDWPGYEVSDRGRVRSRDRLSSGEHPHFVKGRVLRLTQKPNNGYLAVPLCRDGIQSTVNVHRLVAEAFLGSRPEGYDTCHNDGNHLNNAASNLRYDTRSENVRDQVRHGTHPWANALTCRRGHAFTPANTRLVSNGRSIVRSCRTCARAASVKRRKRSDSIETRSLRAA